MTKVRGVDVGDNPDNSTMTRRGPGFRTSPGKPELTTGVFCRLTEGRSQTLTPSPKTLQVPLRGLGRTCQGHLSYLGGSPRVREWKGHNLSKRTEARFGSVRPRVEARRDDKHKGTTERPRGHTKESSSQTSQAQVIEKTKDRHSHRMYSTNIKR